MIETDQPYLVYTLHIDPPVGRSRHYVGSTMTEKLPQRMRAHVHGYGASLTARASQRRCRIVLVHLLPAPTREEERRIKKAGHFDRRCFLCNPALAEPPYAATLVAQLDLWKPNLWKPFAF